MKWESEVEIETPVSERVEVDYGWRYVPVIPDDIKTDEYECGRLTFVLNLEEDKYYRFRGKEGIYTLIYDELIEVNSDTLELRISKSVKNLLEKRSSRITQLEQENNHLRRRTITAAQVEAVQ